MKTTITSLLFMLTVLSYAQDVKLFDFSVQETYTVNDTSYFADTARLAVMFKVTHPQQADSVFLWFGTQPDTADIYQESLPVAIQGGDTYIIYNGNSYPVNNYDVYLPLWVSRTRYDNASHFTLYVKQVDGTETHHSFTEK